ncbi:hypothetical protein QJS04_geneDACA020243 [Acorus gramineus]|uniref:Reverse transcriptase zinc-binding domain-containing protein n=1 Tax=Acorus gramineus TaxID=55184 RepID=A0AAV9A445_ACOGR|nr:hypothetical protein QJS04_geneDACA020243 [Acorus gramineus]
MRVVEDQPDQIIWKPKPVKGFTVKGGYDWVRRHRAVVTSIARKQKEVWRCKISLKVKAFMWLVYQEKVFN